MMPIEFTCTIMERDKFIISIEKKEEVHYYY